MKKIIFIFLFLLFDMVMLNAKTGPAESHVFYPFQDEGSGLYGIKYNDEIVMLPYFDKLEGGGKEPVFIYYNQDGKAGLFTLEGFVTAPIFDEILPLSPYLKPRYGYDHLTAPRLGLIGNTWKIITIDNLLDLPFECDEICGVWVPDSKYIYSKVLVLRPKNGDWSIYTTSGINLLEGSKIKDFKPEDLIIKREKISKEIGKSYERLRKKAKKDKALSTKLNVYNDVCFTLLRKEVPNTLENSLKLSLNFTSYPIEIAGFKGRINDLGIIDIPFKYDKYDEILKRDPNNLYALEIKMVRADIPYAPTISAFASSEEIDEVERIRLKLNVDIANAYDYLTKEAIRQGWDIDSPLVKHFMEKGNVDAKIKQYNELVAKQEERYAFNRKLDAIASAISNGLMQASEVIGGGSVSSSIPSPAGLNKDSSPAPKSFDNKIKTDGKERNVSEQIRCNSDKRVYERYESMISKAKANGSASASEIKEWQDAMRSLRKKWEDRGYSFPRSSIER